MAKETQSQSVPSDTNASFGEEPLHPHPLANDMTTDSLPARTPEERLTEQSGIGAGPRRVVKVTSLIVAALAMAALIVGAIMFRNHANLLLIGAFAFMLYAVFMAAPLILAAGTKVAQDEAVRDQRTLRRANRRPRRSAR